MQDMLSGDGDGGDGKGAGTDEDGWLRTGGGKEVSKRGGGGDTRIGDVRTVDDSGNLGEKEEDAEEEDEIPDMEDDDDDEEAIIREPAGKANSQ